jgi:hypothetical protein
MMALLFGLQTRTHIYIKHTTKDSELLYLFVVTKLLYHLQVGGALAKSLT